MYNKLNDNTQILNRIEVNTEIARTDAKAARDQVEDFCNRPTNMPLAIAKTKAWDKPLGDIAGDILLQALKVLGVGAVIAVILYGIGAANFS